MACVTAEAAEAAAHVLRFEPFFFDDVKDAIS
jgi:hypothetical protein